MDKDKIIIEKTELNDYLRLSKKRNGYLILKGKYDPLKIIGKKIKIETNEDILPIYRKVDMVEYISIDNYTAHLDRKTTKGSFIKGQTDKVNLKKLKETYKLKNIIAIAHVS